MPDTAVTPTTAHDPDFVVELAGKRISHFCSLTAALSAGLKLKRENAGVTVKVYDAREKETA
ncbi:MAG: hypothetical protein KIT48_13765 [Pseudolabrys sp.]|nr:hypothetical protein [Pseudolabrys sp.]